MTVMKSGGQYQVVIGNHVPEVFEDVVEMLDLTMNQAVCGKQRNQVIS